MGCDRHEPALLLLYFGGQQWITRAVADSGPVAADDSARRRFAPADWRGGLAEQQAVVAAGHVLDVGGRAGPTCFTPAPLHTASPHLPSGCHIGTMSTTRGAS